MLRHLRVQNFKGWRDTGEVPLAPITIFFGANSAGKTSILQYLLMLKQTAESSDRRRILHLGDQHSLVELGTLKDVKFRHRLDTKIELSLGWDIQKPLQIRDSLSDFELSADYFLFEASITADSKETPTVESFSYKATDLDTLEDVKVSLSQAKPSGRKFALNADNYNLRRWKGRAWELPEPVRFYGFPDEVALYYQNASFVGDLTFQFEKQLRSIYYLGPLREDPSRIYAWSGETPDHVGVRGERAVEAILAASERRIVPRYRSPSLAFGALISKWLTRLGLLSGFSARAIAKDRKEYEVSVRTSGSSTDVLLPDVGFGVSQVLPVVVECFYAPPNSTVVIEQPELHLHPRVQSELADLFIEAISAREDNQDRNMQFIIESHSEHFLRRLQRRVAEGVITPDQIAIYYSEPGPEGATLRSLTVDLFGEIQNWPDDFFGDEMSDLAARLEAASKKEANASR